MTPADGHPIAVDDSGRCPPHRSPDDYPTAWSDTDHRCRSPRTGARRTRGEAEQGRRWEPVTRPDAGPQTHTAMTTPSQSMTPPNGYPITPPSTAMTPPTGSRAPRLPNAHVPQRVTLPPPRVFGCAKAHPAECCAPHAGRFRTAGRNVLHTYTGMIGCTAAPSGRSRARPGHPLRRTEKAMTSHREVESVHALQATWCLSPPRQSQARVSDCVAHPDIRKLR
jgi:hypothetical protein